MADVAEFYNAGIVEVVQPEDYGSFGSLWVDRNGVPYSVYNDEIDGHQHFASNVVDGGCSSILEDRGWIHISGGSAMCYKRGLTRKQREFIIDWAIEWGRDTTNFDNLIYDLEPDNIKFDPERIERAKHHKTIE